MWEAPASARDYVQVGGWDTGSYTLGVRRNAELEADRAVLLEVRDALRGDTRLNWSADVPIGEWEGVLLDGSPARVAGLFLQGRGLSGVIPPGLGKLSGLGALNLSSNALTGAVPSELGDLAGLVVLLLMSNDLSGDPGGTGQPHPPRGAAHPLPVRAAAVLLRSRGSRPEGNRGSELTHSTGAATRSPDREGRSL